MKDMKSMKGGVARGTGGKSPQPAVAELLSGGRDARNFVSVLPSTSEQPAYRPGRFLRGGLAGCLCYGPGVLEVYLCGFRPLLPSHP